MRIYDCGYATVREFFTPLQFGHVVIKPAPSGLLERIKLLSRWVLYLSLNHEAGNCWCRFLGHSFIVKYAKRQGDIPWAASR